MLILRGKLLNFNLAFEEILVCVVYEGKDNFSVDKPIGISFLC